MIRNMTGMNSPGPAVPQGSPTPMPQGQMPGQPAMPGSLPPNGVQAGQQLAKGGDNIPAQVTDQQGNVQGPAAIKQGEIVFSVESIIGAGNGDYNKGAQLLLGLHDKLQAHGDALNQQNSLAGASQPSQDPSQGMGASPQGPQGLAAAPMAAPAQGLPQ